MKAVLVDSSVVLDLFTNDPEFAERSIAAMARLGAVYDLAINDIVYAEVSIGFQRIEDLDAALLSSGFVSLPIPREALFLAGKAFLTYRRRGGEKAMPLPDFFIGAHAAVAGIPLLTRDPERVRQAFPRLEIIEP
jgi:predicted nucleic acid-binding protein